MIYRTFALCALVSMTLTGHSQTYDDSLAVDSKLFKISHGQYMNVILAQTNREHHESTDPLAELGITLNRNCDEICEAYLKEKNGKKKMLLPSSFDQGIIDLSFSPSKKRFAIYSSYDGPDYSSYYFYRAEIITFGVSLGKGLKTIKQNRESHLYDWSIEELLWIDDNTVALKVYSGSKNHAAVEGGYSYFKLRLK